MVFFAVVFCDAVCFCCSEIVKVAAELTALLLGGVAACVLTWSEDGLKDLGSASEEIVGAML